MYIYIYTYMYIYIYTHLYTMEKEMWAEGPKRKVEAFSANCE